MSTKAKLINLQIVELSGVDRPCHAPALVALMKRATDENAHATTTTLAALANKSTRTGPLKKADSTMTLDEALAEIEDLKAKLAAKDEEAKSAEKRASLTDGQRAYLKTLDKQDAEAFLAKSFADREEVLAEIAKKNVEVYRSARTGQAFRSSDDPRLVEMAKQADKLADDVAKRDEAIEKAAIRKEAAELLGNVVGDDDTHDLIVKSIRKSGATAEQIEKALTSLRGANALAGEKGVAKGVTGSGEPTGGPAEQLQQLIAKHAVDNKVTRPEATAAVLKTTEGRRLYAESNR